MSGNNNEIIPGGAEYRGKVVSLLGQISGESGGQTIPGGAAFRAQVVSLLKKIADTGGGGGSGSGGNLPSGGTVGQFLVKQSATDYDAAWVTVPSAQGVSF